ncbi:DNA helicase PIF1 ATP-dependent [Penicillium robsamsonii]|uniref:DNA helicase PIF1 ATP-dependent n=1 Tax=Penicillium robsamsonii TaxID=1792511 RepID=UPI002548B5A6|nr:DNA helicase PIF1 ATP-dependent [Penicillium robsamsonii]KAJ5812728.1 DNA helicase PIF1 ATP-dependent [Penicillium robsamsonii]
MHVARSRARGIHIIRSLSLNCPKRLPSSFAYSSSSRPAGAPEKMFKKALQDHPGSGIKPLHQTDLFRANATAPKPQPQLQSGGVKRKIEVAESSLGSLHNAVYFDENDFDDDLDLDEPQQLIAPSVAGSTISKTVTYPSLDTSSRIGQSVYVNENLADVNYPDLPSISQETVAPPSSMQLPWSSSPPAHFQPPARKPRTLPWTKEEEEPREDKKESFVTRKRSKPAEPWNKSESTIKAEQKELRQEYKKTQKSDGKPKQPNSKIATVFLSDEQRAVLDAVVDRGKSMFFTGSAGTGKSVLMREIIAKLRNKYRKEPDRIAVTASTGLAACNIGGVTLHSFAGIGLGKEPVPELVKKIKKNQKARNRWLRTKVLVVDEVSMVDGDLFDKLEEIARRIRNNGRPFGGIQLVVTGDFFQLPPVPDGSNREAKFAFAAASWTTCIQHTILLTNIFRQRDPEFANMLNEMRLGKITPSTIEAFRRLSRPLDVKDQIEATELFPTRAEVDGANSARMGRLSGEVMRFNAIDSGTIQDPQHRDRLLSNCMAPPMIQLKKGAQVMLIKNMEDSLVNGSIGKVVAFMSEDYFDSYKENDKNFADDATASDDERAHRARKRLKPMGYKEGPASMARKWPLVSFLQPDGSERHLLCQPETWKIELPNGEVQAQRQQVPLILAWALSIHKAQGQTLQRVKVDLGRVFEKGQAYVALSRAVSQEGLQVTRFEPRKVMVHPKVVEFYSNLASITEINKSKTSNALNPDDFDDEDF